MMSSLVQVTPKYLPAIGGVEVVVKEISERLVQQGYPVTVYTADLSDGLPAQESINGVLVRRYRPLYGDPLYLPHPSLFRDLRRDTESVIHIHNIHTLLPLTALMLDKCRGIVLQPHYHRFGQSQLRNALFTLHKSFLRSFVLCRIGTVLVNSCYEEHWLRRDFPQLRNIRLLEEAVDVEELRCVQWRPELPKRVLFIGKLLKYKKVDRLLTAFSHLTGGESLRLVIVGDGPEVRILWRQALDLGIQQSIEWKSGLTREELLSEYSRASVLVSLSNLESFGRTTMEALCIGIPVVVPRDGALAKAVGRGMVRCVDPENAYDVAQGITTCLTSPLRNEDRQIWMDWDHYVKELLYVYSSLQQGRACVVSI